MKNNAPKPRKHGRFTTKCRRCGRPGGHIGKYGLELCRTCFREVAVSLGFKKYS
ncbi:MAG TPA: 30S ribosomal protein S14 [Candidatus Nanoarchaeia archaeon]|nr:30S ribosomal protein S14 [Candidatus Nanoarchaeia archaeon]